MSGYNVTSEQVVQEWVTMYGRGETYLRDTVNTEPMSVGSSSAVFALADNGAPLQPRGANGLIPSYSPSDSQVRLSLQEGTFLETHPNFDMFTSQSGGLRKAMQERAVRKVKVGIDDEIMTALETASTSAAIASISEASILERMSDLWANNVKDSITFLWTPRAWGKFLQVSKVTSTDYVEVKPLVGNPAMRGVNWAGATHMMMNGMEGEGTSTASCYVYGKDAVGYAQHIPDGNGVDAGVNAEQKYSWVNACIYHKAGILQQPGVIKLVHDDTA